MARRRALRAVPDQPQRAVLYRRVSALMGRTGEEFHSPELQLEAMRRMAAGAGLREVAVVDDIDVSGQTFSRAGIDRIRAMVQAGEVDVVALYDLSRLGRDLADSLDFIRWLRDHGVSVMSSQERIDDTPEGQYMLGQFLGLAQLYGRQIGRRWSEVIARRAHKGFHHGRPIGYQRVRGRPLVPDPLLGPVVTDAFRAYARGVPIGHIAHDIAERTGRRMHTANIKKWLRNPAYLGHVHADGEIVAFGAHPALVDQVTWDAVQRRLARDTVTPPRHLAPTWALVGLVYCPDGHRLQRQPTRYRGRHVDRLICGMGASRGVARACDGIGNPRLDAVEAEVLRQIGDYLRLLRTDDGARAARMARRAQAGVERSTLERELTRTRSAIARLAKSWALGDTPDAAYFGPVAEFRAAEAALQRQLDGLSEPVVMASADEVANAAEVLLELWPDATMAERGRMLRAVVRRVTVRRAGRWREPEADRVDVDFL